MILADTSAWVEYDRSTGSPVHRRLRDLIIGQTDLAFTEPVLAEVLIGARTDAQESDLRRLLGSFTLLPFDACVDFDGAVRIYRRCRRTGVTPRGIVDCLIAAVSLRYGASLLAQDAGLIRVAQVMGLRLDQDAG